MHVRLAAAVLSLAACKFPRPPDVADDDVTDATPALDATTDTPLACEPSSITCDDARGEYVACSPTGTVDVALHCPLGCAPDAEKCLDIDPHNGLAMYLDMVDAPPDLTLNGPATINTVTGAILDQGVGKIVPTFLQEHPDGTALRVYVVGDFNVLGAVSFPPAGAERAYQPAVAFVAAGSIHVSAPMTLAARGATPGAGGHPADAADSSSCIGGDASAAPPAASRGAGGGGGFTRGGNGGESSTSSTELGGVPRVSIEPLDGGCAGGTVYNLNDSAWLARGGSGGGAIHLASRTEIRFDGAAAIDASGGGGGAYPRIGGGGGGAGGIVLLEAPQVILNGPTVVISTKGGGGGGGSGATAGTAGSDGGTSATAATGGTSSVQAPGGAGGTNVPPQPGAVYQATMYGGSGGGGGSAGMTAAFTTVGAIAPQNGAVIRGPLSTDRLRLRRIP